jgi:hypothetical protein
MVLTTSLPHVSGARRVAGSLVCVVSGTKYRLTLV